MIANATMTTSCTVRICGQHALTLALGMSLALPSAVLAALPPVRAGLATGALVTGLAARRAPGDPKASVEVLVKLDGTDDSIIAERLTRASRDALKDEAVELVGDGEGSVVRVSVRWTADDDDNHEIAIEVVDGDGRRQDVPGSPFACEDCGENQLLAKVAELVPLSVALLPEVEGEPAGVAEGGGEAGDYGSGGDEGAAEGGGEGGGEGEGGADGGERERLGGMGKAGVGLIVAGSVAAGVGGGLMVTDRRLDTVPQAGDARMTVQTDLRPPGIGVLIGGGVVMLTGVALIVVDRLRAKRNRVAVLPVHAPTFTGFSVSGRF